MTKTEIEEKFSRSRLPGLDGLRMVFVLSVIVYHSGYDILFSARHGVSGFFVLSGFLITWLILKEYEKGDGFSIKNFYIRRSLRILPAYYVYVLLSVGADLILGDDRIGEQILPAVFYYTNYYNAVSGHPSSSLSHLWSLSVEEQFYLLWPAIFLLALNARDYKKAVVTVSLTLILVVALWRSYAVVVLGFDNAYVYNAFDTRFDNLLIGCLLAVLLRSGYILGGVSIVSGRVWAPLVTVFLLLISISIPSRVYAYTIGFTVDAVLLAVLITQILCLSDTKLWRWLNFKLVVFFGFISYPAYLWHSWAIQISEKVNFLPDLAQLALAIVITVILACCSYFFVEKYFLKIKTRY